MEKVNCYIEEYKYDGNLMARLRDKKTDKKVVLVGENLDKNHFLRFLSQARFRNNVMPTIFEKNGEDLVAVRGKIILETDDEIEVSIDIENGGYMIE